jgi:hypothetical protein
MKPLIRIAVVFAMMLAAEVAALADSPATPESLHLKALMSRLSAAARERIRGLKTIQCDYRLMGTDDLEESSANRKPPPVKLAASGILTIQLPENTVDEDLDAFPGAISTFRVFRFEPDAWPILTDSVEEAESKNFKPFQIPGSKLICRIGRDEGCWLVSKDDKTARNFWMSSNGNRLFGPFSPSVCCHYEEAARFFGGDDPDVIGKKVKSVSLGERKCALYRFNLPAAGKGKETDSISAGTYSVWLDDATGLPLREEFREAHRGLDGKRHSTRSITAYSDLQSFGKGTSSPTKSVTTVPDAPEKDRYEMEIRYAPFGSRWFLTKEISVHNGDGLCQATFSNWRQVTVPDSFFRLPPEAARYVADHGAKTNKAPPAIRQKPIR